MIIRIEQGKIIQLSIQVTKLQQKCASNLTFYKQIHDHQEFVDRLKSSPINSNRYYLGLLLMTIVSLPVPKIEYIKTLIKFGADINFNEPTLEQEEIKVKKQPNQGIDIGRSILMIACEKSMSANVNYLLSYQNLQVGYLDAYGRSSLYYALCNNNENQAVLIIRSILKQFPHLLQFNEKFKNKTKCQQNNLLFLSLLMNKPKILQFLLQNYINSNHQFQPFGMTALHYTISLSGQLSDQIIKNLIIVLLKFKANPMIKDHLSETCFDYAQKYLFDLQQIIKNEKNQKENYQQTSHINIKNNQCFTLNTYADSRTAFSKDEDYSQVDEQIFNQKKPQQNVDLDEIHISNQMLQMDQRQQNVQKNEQDISQASSEEGYQVSKEDSITFFHYQLSRQIHNYFIENRNTYYKAQMQIQNIFYQLQTYGRQHLQLSLQVIGSFGTGLWTHHSDIDLAFINQKAGYINISKKLRMIYNFLRNNEQKLGVIESYFNSQAKFPNIKLKLNQFHSNRRIQIVIFQKNCIARNYICFIKQCLIKYPCIPPLYSVFHKLLQTFQLHRATKNGIKSYTLFLMILSTCKAYHIQWQAFSLSQIFIRMVYYFCQDFNYECKLLQLNKGQGTYKFIFNLIDPLNSSNNTGGKQTDTQRLKGMFKALKYAIYIGLQKNKYKKSEQNTNYILQYLFQLSRMF